MQNVSKYSQLAFYVTVYRTAVGETGLNNIDLNLSSLQTNTDTFANSTDPDEMARNKPSHQDLHCHSGFDFRVKPLFALIDMKLRDEIVE